MTALASASMTTPYLYPTRFRAAPLPPEDMVRATSVDRSQVMIPSLGSGCLRTRSYAVTRGTQARAEPAARCTNQRTTRLGAAEGYEKSGPDVHGCTVRDNATTRCGAFRRRVVMCRRGDALASYGRRSVCELAPNEDRRRFEWAQAPSGRGHGAYGTPVCFPLASGSDASSWAA